MSTHRIDARIPNELYREIKKYIELYGDRSWEVDALPPDVMNDLLDSAIRQYVDIEKMNLVNEKEKQERMSTCEQAF